MKKKRKLSILPWLLISSLMLLSLTGCSKSEPAAVQPIVKESEAETVPSESEEDSEGVVYLTIATTGNWEGILRGDLMEKYCEKVREWSDGTLRIKMYYNGVLGSDLDIIEGARTGTLCIINSVPSYQTSAVPEAALLDLPGTFATVDEYNRFIHGEYWDVIQNYYQKAGIRLLSSHAFTFRVLTSRFRVAGMQDMKGLRMRSMENQYQVQFWQSMGCTVTPMNWNEVRLAIQQNMLEAQENPLGYLFSSNLAGVQGYVLLSNHVPMISNYLMNEELYQQLSDEHKAILERFFREMEDELVAGEPQEEEEMRRKLEGRGYVFTEPNVEIRQGIEEGREVVLQQLRRNLGEETVDEFLQAVERSRQH